MEALQYMTDELIWRDEFEIKVGHQPQNAFLILLDGSYFCQFSKQPSFIAQAGDIVCFPLESEFTRYVIEPCHIHLIYFTLNQKHPFCSCLPQGKIITQNPDRLKEDKKMMLDLTNRFDRTADLMRQHIINDIFVQYRFETSSDTYTEATLSEEVSRVIDYMIDHIASEITLEELASVAGLSQNGLIKRFHRETGSTPFSYLSHLRVTRSRNLLLSTSLPISQIASLCGFDNIYYFSNTFKKRLGFSPSTFRNLKLRV